MVLKQLKTSKNSVTVKLASCPYLEKRDDNIGFCEAMRRFRVMIPQDKVQAICKTMGPCTHRIAGIQKDRAIERARKGEQRRRRRK